MHIRDQKTQINFMDKNIDLIINSKFIGSQQTHCKKTYITRISKRSATNYAPVGLQRTTHASSERHQWRWWTPPWWFLDWIWCFWNLRWLELIFVDSPRVSGILGYLYRKEAVQGSPEVGTTHLGAPGPPGTPWWVVPPSGQSLGATLAHQESSGP